MEGTVHTGLRLSRSRTLNNKVEGLGLDCLTCCWFCEALLSQSEVVHFEFPHLPLEAISDSEGGEREACFLIIRYA